MNCIEINPSKCFCSQQKRKEPERKSEKKRVSVTVEGSGSPSLRRESSISSVYFRVDELDGGCSLFSGCYLHPGHLNR